MSVRDSRFPDIGKLIKKGNIKSFSQMFAYIPPTVVADAMHWGHTRVNSVMKKPGRLRLEEVYKLADLFKCGRNKMFKIVLQDILD